MELKVTLHESTHEPVTAMIGLAGSVTVRESVELREALVSTLAAADRVLLDVGGITETDPSFFQLLCSARQTAEAAGRELALAPGHSDGGVGQARRRLRRGTGWRSASAASELLALSR